MSSPSYTIDEIEVELSISDGKLTVDSRSGAKSGSVKLSWDENRAQLQLLGPGTDYGLATLTGPQLSNFRTMIDAGLSALDVSQDTLERDRRVLYSGYETLGSHGEHLVTTLDREALEGLGLTDDGEIAGGSRQVRCTVLNSGTAIINLLSHDESEFEF